MSDSPILENIDPKSNSAVPTAAQISGGIPIPAVRLLQVMSSDEWEGFTEEWLSFHKANGTYQSIRRFSGPGDLGLDIVAFTAKEGFAKPWDGYQCKHLRPRAQAGRRVRRNRQDHLPFVSAYTAVQSVVPRPAAPRLHRAFWCRHHTWSALEGPSSPQGGGARQVGEPLRPRNWSRD